MKKGDIVTWQCKRVATDNIKWIYYTVIKKAALCFIFAMYFLKQILKLHDFKIYIIHIASIDVNIKLKFLTFEQLGLHFGIPIRRTQSKRNLYNVYSFTFLLKSILFLLSHSENISGDNIENIFWWVVQILSYIKKRRKNERYTDIF